MFEALDWIKFITYPSSQVKKACIEQSGKEPLNRENETKYYVVRTYQVLGFNSHKF